MIKLELAANGRRIRLDASYPLSGLKGVIPGANFNKGRYGNPYWSLPVSLPVCRLLRAEFGSELEIGPRLWAWAKDEQSKTAAMKTLASARDAELAWLGVLAPRLAKAMESRTYQRVGARYIAEAWMHGAGCLIADQPGLGKTLEAIGGIVESQTPGPYLVVTPKTSVVPVWAREIPRWLDGQTVVTLPDGYQTRDRVRTTQRARRDAALDSLQSNLSLASTWVIVHPEAVRTRVWWVCGVCGYETPRRAGKVELKCKDNSGRLVFHDPELRKNDRVEHEFPQLFGREWGAVIVDESDRSLLRLSGTPTQTRQGMEMLKVRDNKKLELTGTPTRGRPHLIWGQLNWIDPKAFSSFWNFVELHWEVTTDRYSSHNIGRLKDEQGLWQSLDRYVLRRTKDEVAPDLPPKTYVGTPVVENGAGYGVWLPMEGAQAKAYEQMLATSAAELEDGSRVEAIGVLAELMRLKQFAGASGRMEIRKVPCPPDCPGEKPHDHQKSHFVPSLPSNKFEYLVQLLDELGFPDSPQTKVVVVSQFTEMLQLFARELPARLKALSAHPRTALASTMAPVLLTGEQSGRRRELAIEAMNAPVGKGAHLMLLQTKTGGVAITLDRADVMVFLDETWIPDDQEQAEDRIHRVSNPRPVWYHYLRSLDSVDLGIALTNAERGESSRRLLDGRRGVEYARAVFGRTRELSLGLGASLGGNVAGRSAVLRDGDTDGTGTSRAMGRNSGGVVGATSALRRDSSEETSCDALAPKRSGRVQSKRTKKSQDRGDKKSMAKPMSDEAILAYKDKDATAVQERYADWLIEKLELEFPNAKAEAAFREAVRLATALRMIFQASPENQGARGEAKAAAKAATKAAKKSKKAAEADDEDADDDDQDETPAAKPAKKVSKAKAKAKPEPVEDDEPDDDEDKDDTASASPAKKATARKAAPRKASRAGAAAPF